jgi:hypothetical protein
LELLPHLIPHGILAIRINYRGVPTGGSLITSELGVKKPKPYSISSRSPN